MSKYTTFICVGFSFTGGKFFLQGFSVSLFLSFSLLLSLLLKQLLLQRACFLSRLLRCFHQLLSSFLVLFQLLWVRLNFLQLLLKMLEQLNNVTLDLFLKPLLHLITSFILLCRLDVLDNNIVEIIVDNLSYFVASFAVIFAFMLPWVIEIFYHWQSIKYQNRKLKFVCPFWCWFLLMFSRTWHWCVEFLVICLARIPSWGIFPQLLTWLIDCSSWITNAMS